MVVPPKYAVAWGSDPPEAPPRRTQYIKLVYRGGGGVFCFEEVILDLSLKDERNSQREIQGAESKLGWTAGELVGDGGEPGSSWTPG